MLATTKEMVARANQENQRRGAEMAQQRMEYLSSMQRRPNTHSDRDKAELSEGLMQINK